MSITRRKLSFERGTDTFEIPRAWARDRRLSRKARGLRDELLSHAEGFEIKFQHLLDGGPEGKDALSSGLAELEAVGYLKRRRSRSAAGTFEVDYDLSDPFEEPVDNFASAPESTSADNPLRAGFSTAGKSAPLRRDTSLTREEINPVNTQPHLGAVNNFDPETVAARAAEELDPHQRMTLPARVRRARARRLLDFDTLHALVQPVFHDFPGELQKPLIRLLALRIIGKAAKAGTEPFDPTRYVAAAIAAEPEVWRKVAWRLDARP